MSPHQAELWRQLTRFLSVGGIATLLHWGLTLLMVLALGCPEVLASTMGFVISAGFNFWANARFTFQSQQAGLVEMARFTVVATSGLACNAGILKLCLDASLPLYLAQPLATLVVLVWNFALNSLWVFKSRPAGTTSRSELFQDTHRAKPSAEKSNEDRQ